MTVDQTVTKTAYLPSPLKGGPLRVKGLSEEDLDLTVGLHLGGDIVRYGEESSVSTIWSSGELVLMTLPLMKIWPLPLPEATPRSASRTARTVDDATHDGHSDRRGHVLQAFGDGGGELDHIHLGRGRSLGRR